MSGGPCRRYFMKKMLVVIALMLWLPSRSTLFFNNKYELQEKPESSVTQQQLLPLPKDLFNCTSSSLCRYLQPRDLFQSDSYKQILSQHKNHSVNRNLPSLTNFEWLSAQENTKEVFRNVPKNFSFCHVHKCGGTTIKALLLDLKIGMKQVRYNVSITNYRYSIGGGSLEKKQLNSQKRKQHIAYIERQQQQPGASFPVFATVRDPIERFVSGVQQVMHYNTEFRSKCLSDSKKKDAKRETLRCAIDEVWTKFYLNDVHLLPMVTHFQSLDRVQVSVFYMPSQRHQDDNDRLSSLSFSTLLRYLSVENSSSPSTKHAHDRTRVEYATSEILAQMTVEKDCDEDMIRTLCDLYRVDVIMLQSLGFPTPYC